MAYLPLIIIGAPRSGTNMFRDALCSLDGVATWPCDEINYIWRHGNIRYPSDEIPAARANQSIRSYIRKQFDWVARRYEARAVVEKTCANSLRVPFVDRVMPDAKYVFIYRDGVDATGSARLRWTAELDIPYLLKKVRFVPATDLPYYGGKYLCSRLYRLSSRDRRVAFWGPIMEEMDKVLEAHSLNEVCALQWQRCVDKAVESFANMSADRVVRVCYEDFVRQPRTELSRVLSELGLEAEETQIQEAVANVSCRSVGKGRMALTEEEVVGLELLVRTTLKRHGYL